MKKVLMFLDYYGFGGIEKIIQDIKENIHTDKFQIEVLSFVNNTDDLSIVSLLSYNERSFFKRNVKSLKKFSNYLKENSFSIIHIHCYNSFGLIYARIARKYCKKVIVHAHNSSIDRDLLKTKYFIHLFIKKVFANQNFIYIAPTLSCSNFCFQTDHVFLLPNAICYQKYCFNNSDRLKYRKLLHLKEKEIIIGHIGRFEEQKNHSFLIDVFNEIIKIDSNYKLILVGEGKLLNKIKKKVARLHLEKKVLFLGNRSDVSRLINAFDMYLFPSKFEGLPLTLIENQVNGKMVFCSDKVSKSVVVSNKVRFLSLKESSANWAFQIVNSMNLKLKLENRLDIKNYIEQIESIYEKRIN